MQERAAGFIPALERAAGFILALERAAGFIPALERAAGFIPALPGAGMNPAARRLPDVFDIMDWGILSGTFDHINLPGVNEQWDLSRLYLTGEIGFVPEPTTFVLLGLGGLMSLLLVLRRPKRRSQ